MEYVLVTNHNVTDYTRWKTEFDKAHAMRRDGGEQEYHIFYIKGEPNKLVLLFKWDSLDHARKYFESAELRRVMKQAGVIGEPELQFLEPIEERST